MARFRRMETLQAMYDTGLVVVFYHEDPETVCNVAQACAAGGLRCLEFTNRGDFAYQTFGELERYCRSHVPELITGVGSIVDPHTAALYVNQGANFVVGPLLNDEVARFCNRRKIPYSPGCGSVSEIGKAEELGCEIVKVFPGAEVGGPEFVRNVLGPCPWVSIMPTGGVEPSRESLTEWFGAGIVCAGIGSKLVTKELLAKKDWSGITAKVSAALALIKEIRTKK